MSRFRSVTAGLVVVLAVFMGVARGLFAHPNLGLGLLAVAVLPFLIDVRDPGRLRAPAVGLGAISLVIAATTALMVVEPARMTLRPSFL